MSTLSIILILGAIAFVAALAFSPAFRQLFRIRSGKAIDAGSSALEKQQDQYKLLTSRIPAQRNSVATTKAGAVIAQKKLNALTEKLTALETEFKAADTQKAPADVVSAIEAEYASTEAAITEQKTIATEAANVADEALKALEQTVKALAKFATQIERDSNKVELKKSLEIAAESRQQLNDMKTEISGAGAASAQIDKELEIARAKNDMSKGSSTDQAREEIAANAAAAAAGSRLRAKLGMNTEASSTNGTEQK